jgi:membrane dipeptidase
MTRPKFFCACLAALLLASCALLRGTISDEARALHFDSIVVDTHDDTTQRLLTPDFDLGARHADGSIDIPRMRDGGLDALFFSIWIPGTVTGAEAVRQAGAQIEAVHRQIRSHPRDLVLATTAAEVRAAQAGGRIAALMGVEGGHMIANKLANLRRFFELGARYMTLTHSVNVDWADSSTDTPKHKGLSRFGKRVVREMNRLGMIVDVSHVSDETFYDVLALSKAPVIASHSSARALCNSLRNLSDQMIRDLAASGGVIQINYHMGFLSQPFRDAINANDKKLDSEIDAEGKRRCGADEACDLLVRDRLVREYVRRGMLPRVEWTAIVDHIDHVVKVVGARHVGLGSDFDGAYIPYGMEDASFLPKLTGALLKKGYSVDDIRNILGGNTLRVMEEVEAAARLAR